MMQGLSTRYVPGIGPRVCDVAIVGEAPGEEEDKALQPFKGRAGKLLTDFLTNVGIIRTQCYLTNVIKHRPFNNDASIVINLDTRKQQVEETPQWKAYVNTLRDELKGVQSNVIVACGGKALYALTGERHITKWRGSVMESTLLPGRKVIPIIHPSATYHRGNKGGGNYLYTYYIQFDMQKIKEQSEYPEIRRVQRDIKIEPTYEEAMMYLKQILNNSKQIAYDIETGKLELSCIAFAKSPTDIMCIPFFYNGQNYFTPEHETMIMSAISQILGNPRINKIAQNSIFDSSFLMRKYGIYTYNQHDTMIAQAIIAPDLPKGLDFLTSVYTNESYYKDEGKDWKKISDYHRFWNYNAKDAAVTFEIWPQLERDLNKMGIWETYFEQNKLVKPCTFMNEKGILIDKEGMAKTDLAAKEKIEKQTEELLTYTSKLGMTKFNTSSSSPDGKIYFYSDEFLGLTPYIHFKTKKPTLDGKALKRIARKGFKEAQLLLDIRQLTTLRNRYYGVTLSKDDRIRSEFNPVGAADSGRLSSKKDIYDEGGNLQNQPPEMKPFLLFDPGYIGYQIDLKNADGTVTAYVADERKMIEAIESKVDMHSLTASFIFDYSYDEIRQMHKDEVCADLGRGTDTHRFWGKKANHSFNYGEGAKMFALYSELEEREGKFIYNRWHQAYPGIRLYWEWVRNQLRAHNRVLTNLFGRRRLFLAEWGDQLYKEAYSWIPQSTVADKINRQGLNYVYYNQEKFAEVELLNQIHDSIVFQIPIKAGKERHYEIVSDIVNSLEQPLEWRGRPFKIPIEIKVGISIADAVETTMNKDQFIGDLDKYYAQTQRLA